MKTRSLILAIILSMSVVVGTVNAATHYVFTDCSGKPTPCYTSIQAAIDVANPGDTVQVGAGTYYEHVRIAIPNLRLIGEDRDTTIIDGGGNGDIIYVNANNVEISRFTIQKGWRAIYLDHSDNRISDNIIIDNIHSIYLFYSNNNIISSNIVSYNYYGIILEWSSNNIIEDNLITSNVHTSITLEYTSDNNFINANILIILDSPAPGSSAISLEYNPTNNIISNNIMINHYIGIQLHACDDNSISNNFIANNYFGLRLTGSSSNSIYHNNIIDNTVQAEDFRINNIWDNGAGEGNYWSDYIGVDDGSGVGRFGEPRIAGDGIGDTLIPHPAANYDYYPFMEKDGWIKTPFRIKNRTIPKLESAKTGDSKIDEKIDKAIQYIQKSLDDKLWINETHLNSRYGNIVFSRERSAIRQIDPRKINWQIKILERIIKWKEAKSLDTSKERGKIAALQDLLPVFEDVIDDLVKADEIIARSAIEDAKGIVVDKPYKQRMIDYWIAMAEKELEKAYKELDKNRPDRAISRFESAWRYAQIAISIRS